MINVAVGWQLYERTGDAWALGLVGVAELTPVLFLMVTAFMMYYLITQRPMQSLAGLLMMLAGFLIYAISLKRTPLPST